jgi:hypothetical protein
MGLSSLSRDLGLCHACLRASGRACRECETINAASDLPSCHRCSESRVALWCSDCTSSESRSLYYCYRWPNIHDYIVVACAGCCSLLTNASECISDFRAGTGPSGPQSVTCPSGPLNQAADGRIHFYWYLPDNAPFVFWRPRGMFSITSCLHIACHRLWA